MHIIIDRFEEDKAILELETGAHIVVPRSFVADFSEGDVLFVQKDEEKTNERKRKAEDILRTLFE